jgi:LysR family glycine cleavage system transcriptional activator
MRTLTRLKSLQAFEAVARHGSYVGAGGELQVTAAAVGQLVRSLETYLGAPLFHRRLGAERLALTDDARAALGDVAEGLDRLEAGLRRLTTRKAHAVITVTASQVFTTKWLLPRLDDFAARHPEIDLRLDVSDRMVNLAQGEADIGVRFGGGLWPGVRSTLLTSEEMVAVCAPELLTDEALADPGAWLSTQTLIHDCAPGAGQVFPTWSDWLARAGLPQPSGAAGLRINAPAAVIQAAIKGHGVALARRALVAHDLAEGRLRQLLPEQRWPIEWSYFAVASARALRKPEVTAFHDWLVERARPTSPAAPERLELSLAS